MYNSQATRLCFTAESGRRRCINYQPFASSFVYRLYYAVTTECKNLWHSLLTPRGSIKVWLVDADWPRQIKILKNSNRLHFNIIEHWTLVFKIELIFSLHLILLLSTPQTTEFSMQKCFRCIADYYDIQLNKRNYTRR